MCQNMDEMISYALFCLLLAGRISKLAFSPDLVETRPLEEVAEICLKCIIDDKLEHLAAAGGLASNVSRQIEMNGIKLHPLKSTLHGAQLVSRGLMEHDELVFGGVAYNVYGMVETFPMAYSTFADDKDNIESRLEARMHPKMNIEMRLVDEENQVVNIGEEGEIQVKTYSRLKEYRVQEEKTRQLFTDDGFLRTGDMGIMYPDGSISIKGRAADAMRFKVFGDVVYPGPIEQAVSLHPKVAQVSVVCGLKNDSMGDEIVYCIRLKENVEQLADEEIEAICEGDQTIMPARVIYMDRFPSTANGRKVSKKLLRDKVLELLTADKELGKLEWFRSLERGINSNF